MSSHRHQPAPGIPHLECIRERKTEMRNSYEAGEIVDLGKAEHLILGVKYIAPFDFDWIFGMGFISWFFDDIDEGDE
jgi:hypothetical protein